ncbi:MAG: DUF3347 domain-containing protein, partial [Leptospiraceae bacterium]|nr:DUF3347 domain-containing protein [Leptospiraceae bacterium]
LFSFFYQCEKPNREVKVLSQDSRTTLLQIFTENEKVNEQLFKSDTILPDVSSILEIVTEAKNKVKEPGVLAYLGKMEENLKGLDNTKREEYLKSFSDFSINLAELNKMYGVASDYNRFFCPMVMKTWVKKGKEIKNPYASDMRNCGEIVK